MSLYGLVAGKQVVWVVQGAECTCTTVISAQTLGEIKVKRTQFSAVEHGSYPTQTTRRFSNYGGQRHSRWQYHLNYSEKVDIFEQKINAGTSLVPGPIM